MTDKDEFRTTAASCATSVPLHQTHMHAELEKQRLTHRLTNAAALCDFRVQGSGAWRADFRSPSLAFPHAAPASLGDPEVQFCSLGSGMSLSLKRRDETQEPRYLFYVFQIETTKSAAAADKWGVQSHLLQRFGTVSFYCMTHYMYQTTI